MIPCAQASSSLTPGISRLLPLLQHDSDMFSPYPGNEFEQIPSRHDAGAGRPIKTPKEL